MRAEHVDLAALPQVVEKHEHFHHLLRRELFDGLWLEHLVPPRQGVLCIVKFFATDTIISPCPSPSQGPDNRCRRWRILLPRPRASVEWPLSQRRRENAR